MTDREHALLVRIQLLGYKVDHYYLAPADVRQRWLDEIAELSAQLRVLRETQS